MNRTRAEMLENCVRIGGMIWPYLVNPAYSGRDPFNEITMLAEDINTMQIDCELYGRLDEIKAMQNFITAIQSGKSEQIGKSMPPFMALTRDRFRLELGLEPIIKDKNTNIIPFRK